MRYIAARQKKGPAVVSYASGWMYLRHHTLLNAPVSRVPWPEGRIAICDLQLRAPHPRSGLQRLCCDYIMKFLESFTPNPLMFSGEEAPK